MKPLLLDLFNEYDSQAILALLIMNLLLIGWVGLVWIGKFKGKATARLMTLTVFLILVAAAGHAIIAPSLAR